MNNIEYTLGSNNFKEAFNETRREKKAKKKAKKMKNNPIVKPVLTRSFRKKLAKKKNLISQFKRLYPDYKVQQLFLNIHWV